MNLLVRKLGRESRDYLAITFGLICYAIGWAAFLLPYQITTGGVTGIAAIIYYATGVEIQISYFLLMLRFEKLKHNLKECKSGMQKDRQQIRLKF